ncbi:SDR family oxidoreductase [Pseudomonas sp. F(2018)]|jgi:NAD(P)-dependent dehydrogenase (short-subunit alcohol dehydrogenase family)|uniref:SDR family oxidoreductase n=1 Tax=Pseudomonas sp. F(2018) TaxID=2502240 RepID=UPI0010F4735E|nr:SDR family oxidoreductase [Pseudomonas sp. F(2018)]
MTQIFGSEVLQGQHAFLTGAGSGINLSIAKLFASQGASVSIVGRNLDKAQAAAADINAAGGRAAGFSADVRDIQALTQAMVEACQRFGPINICVAGAAGNFVAKANKLSANGFRTVVDIDLMGTFNTFRTAYDFLRRPASLLAISAVQSSLPMFGQAHVCAAKAGVEMLVRSLSVEWAAEGIRCNAIAPGPVDQTEGMSRLAPEGEQSWAQLLQGIPSGRAGRREEIANLALFLASGAASYINGTVVVIDGGQSNLGSFTMGSVLKNTL